MTNNNIKILKINGLAGKQPLDVPANRWMELIYSIKITLPCELDKTGKAEPIHASTCSCYALESR